jgi:hypothetical protein
MLRCEEIVGANGDRSLIMLPGRHPRGATNQRCVSPHVVGFETGSSCTVWALAFQFLARPITLHRPTPVSEVVHA